MNVGPSTATRSAPSASCAAASMPQTGGAAGMPSTMAPNWWTVTRAGRAVPCSMRRVRGNAVRPRHPSGRRQLLQGDGRSASMVCRSTPRRRRSSKRSIATGWASSAHRNGLNLRGRIRFPAEAADAAPAMAQVCANMLLVAIGGGKVIRLVSIEASAHRRRRADRDLDRRLTSSFAACAEHTGIADPTSAPAPQLFDFNRQGRLEWHSGDRGELRRSWPSPRSCWAWTVVFSNERSASHGSTDPRDRRGQLHQWSGGWAFGSIRQLAAVARRHRTCRYSLLRPLANWRWPPVRPQPALP